MLGMATFLRKEVISKSLTGNRAHRQTLITLLT